MGVEVLDGVVAVAISKTICWVTPLNQRNLVDVFIFNCSNLRHEFFGDVLLLQRAHVANIFFFKMFIQVYSFICAGQWSGAFLFELFSIYSAEDALWMIKL